MIFFDKSIKGLIQETETDVLNNKGLGIPLGKRFLDLRIGNYGIADMIVATRIQGGLGIVILLFKDYEIGIKDFINALEIRRGIERFYQKRGCKLNYTIKIKIKLVGGDLEKSGGFRYLPNLFPGIENIVYSLGVEGLSFKSLENCILTDEGF